MQPSILSSLHFDLLIRGFIPSSLFQVVKSVVGTTDHTNNAIATMLYASQSILKCEIWKERNTAMIAFEQEHNITTRNKKARSSSATRTGSTSIGRTSLSLPPTKRWITWITQHMITGLPWLEFSHTY